MKEGQGKKVKRGRKWRNKLWFAVKSVKKKKKNSKNENCLFFFLWWEGTVMEARNGKT